MITEIGMRVKASLVLKAPSLTKSFFFFFLWLLLQMVYVQCQTIDPSEVAALNSITKQWIWSHGYENPCLPSTRSGFTCDCRYNNGSTCHITGIYLFSRNIEGVLLEDIGDFTYLRELFLYRNYFSGPLPSSIGKLTNLQLLSIEYNAFSGAIPKELGSLSKLSYLSIGANNFSGTLPPELGNLVNLEYMYLQSCGDVGGEIPSSFANLVNMQYMLLSDNSFTGKIPDFIGNWSKLQVLRIEGNSFEGPIPSSFASLTSIWNLRISDLLNGSSSSLDFIKNMKNLTTLILRNALISDSIPLEITEFRSLKFLDLSFNKLTGQIPSALFNMSSLINLFLGNNSLIGVLPTQKSGILENIDLSYNELSGDLSRDSPDWLMSGLRDNKVNIVANNFVFSNQNPSSLSNNYRGLQYLQRNFSYNKNIPLQTRFSVDCGGSGAAGNDGTNDYYADSSVLGPASFYAGYRQTWVVSSAGAFVDNDSLNYLQSTSGSILNTYAPGIFRTSRSSAGSLRYYGLGLENGNYTVTLMFAETLIPDRSNKSYLSSRRRIFDIYIQGNLQVKDFNIAKEAGGVDRALEKIFSVEVGENYLEIHLFWAGKGTCCDNDSGIYGPSIAGLNVFLNRPNYKLLPPRKTRPNYNLTRLVAGISVAIVLASLVLVIFITCYIKKKKSDAEEDKDLIGIGPTFSYFELRTATDDFNAANKLGEGGFGPVYKGLLPDGRAIAVKQLSIASHQGKCEFLAEIDTISAVRHQNLVKLYGCCIEKNRQLLVYEYLERKSLDQALFEDNDCHLDWPARFNICLGTAKGLAYLHEDLRPRIIHRDIKASNILLDAKLNPKISDFGLAKLFDDRETHISTRIAGTIGYLAPEYAMFGHLTEKADIFGFGVVTLEILSGRPNTINASDNKKQYVLEWAWNLYENDRCLELLDPKLEEFDEEEAVKLMKVAVWCTQSAPAMRPPMSRVISMLLGNIEVNPVTSKPTYLTDMTLNELSSVLTNEEASSSLLEGR